LLVSLKSKTRIAATMWHHMYVHVIVESMDCVQYIFMGEGRVPYVENKNGLRASMK